MNAALFAATGITYFLKTENHYGFLMEEVEHAFPKEPRRKTVSSIELTEDEKQKVKEWAQKQLLKE